MRKLILFLIIASPVYAQLGGTSPANGPGIGAGASPVMGFYLGPNCPSANIGQCFYTTADVQQANDCSWGTGSGVITCNSSHFTVADLGKSVMGAQTCVPDLTIATAAAGLISTSAMPTITTFTSGTSVTISANPANAATLQTTFPVGACFIWGHFDDAGASAVDTALQSASQCPKLFLAAANYMFASPHFFTQPTACNNISPVATQSTATAGNTYLPAGFEIEGRGTGNTAIFLSTTFPSGDTCAHTPPGNTPVHAGGCFAIPLMGKWTGFRIDGGQQPQTSALTGKTLIIMGVGTLEDFTCLNYGWKSGSASVGIELFTQAQLYQVNNAGCGNSAFYVESGGADNTAVRIAAESPADAGLNIGGAPVSSAQSSFTCYWCVFALNPTATSGGAAIFNVAGVVRLFGGRNVTGNGQSGNVNTGVNAYSCATTSGCVLYADGATFDGSFGSSGTPTDGGIKCSVACTNYVKNSIFKSQTSGFDYQDVSSSKFFDQGGNTFTPRFSISGSVFGSLSATGTTQTTGNIALTSGWSSSSVSAASGNSGRQLFTITAAGTPSANPVVTVTFPTAFMLAPICSIAQDAGTFGVLTNPSVGTPTTTTVAITFSGTAVAAQTYTFVLTCGN